MPEKNKEKEKKAVLTVDLTQMDLKQEGVVASIDGGQGLIRRLEAMGIRTGVRVSKLSSQFMQGPVIVKTGNTRIALGFGMAKKILVNIDFND